MDDAKIVQLYWDRDEQAIPATAEKYGSYCAVIAGNILGNPEDAEECVNDAYMCAWNAMERSPEPGQAQHRRQAPRRRGPGSPR